MRHYFILLLLVFYIFHPVHLDNYSKISNSTNYEQKVLTINNSVESKLNEFGQSIEVIFFATSKVEYEQFLEIGKIKRSYPNLQALRLDLSSQLYNQLLKQFPHQIFPSQIFDSIQIHSQNIIPDNLRFDNTQIQDLTQIDELWSHGYNGTGVVAVVFDNGVDFTHPALKGKKLDFISVASENTQPCKTHGTPVAGMLAANPTTTEPDIKGTGFGAQLVDISLGCTGDGSISGNFLKGFDYIINNNDTIDVINTSFGGFAPPWDFITEKIEQSGIVIVGSAGNEGPFQHSTTTGGPGNSIHGISIGAINSDGTLAAFSSRGPVIDMLFKPDLLAPGVGLKAPFPDDSYGSVQGTSFSSPIIAGGVASLISALEANGFEWNPGVIKAAMLRSANTISTNELATGQGIVNFNSTWQLLQNIGKDKDTPEIVMITPKIGPINYLRDIPQGEIVKVPISLISSHPMNTILSFSGDLKGISKHTALENKYSQKVVINIDTSSLSPNQQIAGNVTAQIGSDTVDSEIIIELGEKIKAKIGVDLHHTYWDQIGSDEIGGGNIGEMIKLAMKAGYWVEEIDTTLTEELLQNYDIIWLPDPNNLMNVNNPSLSDMGFIEFPLLQSEITALTNFVSNGGSLLVDSNGYRNDTVNGSERKIGLNATGLNLLLSNFDIFVNEIPIIEPTGSTSVSTLNLTSLVKGVEKITHFGNYLTVGENGWALSRDNSGRITNAFFIDKNSGGKVMVASTNFWMDNFGIKSLYNAGDNNPKLASNLWDWFTSPISLVKISDTSTSSSISGSYKLLINGSSTIEEPELYLEQNRFHNRQNINPEKQYGSFYFNFSIKNIGIYRIIAKYQRHYITWENIIDNQGPSIIPEDNTINGSTITEADNYFFTFTVKDDVSGFDESSVEVFLNQEKIDPTIIYTQTLEQLNIIIQDETIEKFEQGPYLLLLVVKDKVGNVSKYLHVFNIGTEVPDSSNISSNETQDALSETTKKRVLSIYILYWFLPFSIIFSKKRLKLMKKLQIAKKSN